ncbi:MAG TPA: hypothetical protein VHE34_04500 [Puia sp.]|uniref:hypothetical protein n=1 Tax=Puia sp. TaxID=2045100 RepID=UPI002B9AECFF|nr:hypothetical protein [Puia sp.]HVU94457.1 hypothetical protein [Puia sp.]
MKKLFFIAMLHAFRAGCLDEKYDGQEIYSLWVVWNVFVGGAKGVRDYANGKNLKGGFVWGGNCKNKF